MSQIVNGGIVLQGTAAQAIPGFSLYLTLEAGTSSKDALYELVGQVPEGAKSLTDCPPETVWDIFQSYGRILKNEKPDRTRKILASNVTSSEAIQKITDNVLRKRKGYVPKDPPDWWKLPTADIPQIDVMLATMFDGEGGLEYLEELYTNDDYIVELKYDGHRAKAHFTGGELPKVRFDSRRRSDKTGLFTENTDQLPHLSGYGMNWAYQDFVRKFKGVILDGEIIHDKGIYAVGSVMGALPDKAMDFQKANGWARYIVFDCLAWNDELCHVHTWQERRALAEQVVDAWRKELPDPDLVQLAPFWAGTADKQAIRTWAFANGWEGTVLKRRTAKYVSGRSPDWVKDKKQKRFTCMVTGFEDSTSAAYGPKGWIKCIKVSQQHDGVWHEVASVGIMRTEVRQWFSENRLKALGSVVEIEAMEQNKATNVLRHPRFVCFSDKNASDCTIGQPG